MLLDKETIINANSSDTNALFLPVRNATKADTGILQYLTFHIARAGLVTSAVSHSQTTGVTPMLLMRTHDTYQTELAPRSASG